MSDDEKHTLIRCRDLVLETEDGPVGPFSLEVRQGASFAVIGPDEVCSCDCLRGLAGVEPPLSGELEILHLDPSSLPWEEWAKLRCKVGYVARQVPLLSVLDALENVSLPLMYHHRHNEPRAKQTARACLNRLGWDGDFEHLPAFLTEYQRRMVAVARAMVLKPSILMVAEPFPIFDVTQWKRVTEMLRELMRLPQLTVAVATSNLAFAQRHAEVLLFVSSTGYSRVFPSWSAFVRSSDEQVNQFLADVDTQIGV